jgi:hypothetical protein
MRRTSDEAGQKMTGARDEVTADDLLAVLRDPRPAPWKADPGNLLSPEELALLHRICTGQFGDGPSVVYSSPGRGRPSQRLLRALDGLGVIQFTDATAGNWERGMWGARLTCAGANAVFRGYPVHLIGPGPDPGGVTGLDGHPGCTGGWRPDGACTNCPAKRPLDKAAYEAYLAALGPARRDEQVNGPQLFCTEHGWLRRADITTTKVCRLPGTVFHDGGLFRV